jgi:hypothetical protein
LPKEYAQLLASLGNKVAAYSEEMNTARIDYIKMHAQNAKEIKYSG